MARGSSVETRGEGAATADSVESARATLSLRDGSYIRLDRRRSTATFRAPAAVAHDEVLHPGLGFVGAVFGHWLGRETFHGGGVVVGGGVWGVLGETGAGKSTLLAWLAQRGYGVAADDFLVVGERTCFPGPRCIDLRDSASAQLGLLDALPRARRGYRSRMPVGDVAPALPLHGWIFPSWSATLAARRLSVSERLRRLSAMRLWWGLGTPATLLDLAALPAWELARPKRWDALEASEERLVALAGRRKPGRL